MLPNFSGTNLLITELSERLSGPHSTVNGLTESEYSLPSPYVPGPHDSVIVQSGHNYRWMDKD